MAEIIEFGKFRSSGSATERSRPKKLSKRRKGHGSLPFAIQTLSTPFAAELMKSRTTPPAVRQDESTVLESGVLAFRRDGGGPPLVLLISKRRSKRWGIPKGRVLPHIGFHENAAKEAFEEAGVIGYVSPFSVGTFRAEKRARRSPSNRIIEVWVYLLEVTEMLADWPEKDKRTTRWVSCEAAARQLREPVLAHLCHRLAQS